LPLLPFIFRKVKKPFLLLGGLLCNSVHATEFDNRNSVLAPPKPLMLSHMPSYFTDYTVMVFVIMYYFG